jgi:hypothetical protein
MSDIGMKLWASGIRGDMRHHFYDIPLGKLKPFNDEFLIATVAHETEEGRETCQFVFDRQMLIDSVARMPSAIRDAMLDTNGAFSEYLRFDLVASLTQPKVDVCPLFVERITPSALTTTALTPFDEELEESVEDENADDEWDEHYFPIAIDYKPVIARLVASCDLLLERSDLVARDISRIGKLKYALSRLPLVTEGVGFDVLLSHRADDTGSWGGRSLELRSGRFAVSYSGYIQGPVGGDSDCRSVYECECGPYRSDFDDDPATVYNAFEDWVDGWESSCNDQTATLQISDDMDDFEWNQFEDESAWEGMPKNYV